MLVTGIIAVAILALPPASLITGWAWARRLRRSSKLPRFAIWVAHTFVALGGVVSMIGFVLGGTAILTAPHQPGDTRDKARALAEGISEVMNCGALGAVVAASAAVWLGFWRWRAGRRGDS
jgi:cytochrome bd-type quinol oxidase subunit 2